MAVTILQQDVMKALPTLPDQSVHCVVTSPPYFGLRDYGHDGQIGLEATPAEYVAKLVNVFREVRRVLRDDGTVWLNLGDSYGGSRCGEQGANGQMVTRTVSQHRVSRTRGTTQPGGAKQLLGIPWRVAFALQDDGWYLRQDIIWHKPNPMPESVTDRCTKAHEYVFLLSKSARYHFDAKAIAEAADPKSAERYKYGVGGAKNQHLQDTDQVHTRPFGTREYSEDRNRRSVWTLTTQPYKEAHFATFPPSLPELCIKAGCPEGGTVLDPFGGAGTTALVADRLGRDAILIELNPEYAEIARERIYGDAPMFAQIEMGAA